MIYVILKVYKRIILAFLYIFVHYNIGYINS